MYHFNLGELGLTFLSITVGVIIAIAAYWSYIYYIMEPEIRAHGLGAPERRLIPALVSSIFCPVGLFIFGWSSNPDVHWIGSVIGVSIFTIGIFVRLFLLRPADVCARLLLMCTLLDCPPMHLRLPTPHIPSIRRLPLRRQRLHALYTRLWRHPFLLPALS